VSDTVYDLPADMAVAQAALGTFRGLAINFLWQRAENLKNEGKYYEAIRLGELITRLQPRYPRVWEFVSWNQAYNISVATHTPEERWMWVKSGIDLLQRRGGGIDANPNDLALYTQLGWIYYHKGGEFMDNMSWHYKTELADIWNSILGTPPRSREEDLERLRPVLEAPDRVDPLPEGAQRLARWIYDQGYKFDRHTLKRFAVPVRAVELTPEEAAAARGGAPAAEGEAPLVRIVPELTWPEWATDADIEQVVGFLQRRAIMSDELNMDPQVMYSMIERFGPVDWRHPSAHTLYWSQTGLDRVSADAGRMMYDHVNTQSNVLNALVSMAQSGQVIFQPGTEVSEPYLSYLPAWDFWLAYDDYYNDLVDPDDARRSPEEIEEAFGAGYRNQMDAAIAEAYWYGGEAIAEQLYSRMLERFAGTWHAERYERPLADFAFDQIIQNIDQPRVIRGTIVALITQSITNRVVYGSMQGKLQEAERQFETAQRIHDEYRRLNPNPNDPLYPELPDFRSLHINAVAAFISGAGGPVGVQRVPLEYRASVYRQLDPEVQAVIMLQHREELMREAQSGGYDPNQVFPPPPAEVIERVRQAMNAQQSGGGNTPPPGSRTQQEIK